MEEEYEEEIIKRFGCAECGHSFAMECESPDMTPRFCPFCAAPVYSRMLTKMMNMTIKMN